MPEGGPGRVGVQTQTCFLSRVLTAPGGLSASPSSLVRRAEQFTVAAHLFSQEMEVQITVVPASRATSVYPLVLDGSQKVWQETSSSREEAAQANRGRRRGNGSEPAKLSGV